MYIAKFTLGDPKNLKVYFYRCEIVLHLYI